MALVIPDTSPRGAGVEGEEDSWDFGTGAGFYVDATADPWATNYKMHAYITEELPGRCVCVCMCMCMGIRTCLCICVCM